MNGNILFKTWNRSCQICGSNDVSELNHIYYPYHASGYICSNCDRIYEFEEVKNAMNEHGDHLMEQAIRHYVDIFLESKNSQEIFEKVCAERKKGGA